MAIAKRAGEIEHQTEYFNGKRRLREIHDKNA
jgi:hypothetical protein